MNHFLIPSPRWNAFLLPFIRVFIGRTRTKPYMCADLDLHELIQIGVPLTAPAPVREGDPASAGEWSPAGDASRRGRTRTRRLCEDQIPGILQCGRTEKGRAGDGAGSRHFLSTRKRISNYRAHNDRASRVCVT